MFLLSVACVFEKKKERMATHVFAFVASEAGGCLSSKSNIENIKEIVCLEDSHLLFIRIVKEYLFV